LAQHREALHFISPTNLEHLVGRVFADFMSCEAVHLGGPSDGGIDLVLVHGDRDYVVQVKRRANPNSVEAVSGIREFIGAMLLSGSPNGLFVTTAPRFSASAATAAATASNRKIVDEIALIDGNRLFDVCGLTAPREAEPWKRFAVDGTQPAPTPEPDAHFVFPIK
jgi:restriction endonuclease Mrr